MTDQPTREAVERVDRDAASEIYALMHNGDPKAAYAAAARHRLRALSATPTPPVAAGEGILDVLTRISAMPDVAHNTSDGPDCAVCTSLRSVVKPAEARIMLAALRATQPDPTPTPPVAAGEDAVRDYVARAIYASTGATFGYDEDGDVPKLRAAADAAIAAFRATQPDPASVATSSVGYDLKSVAKDYSRPAPAEPAGDVVEVIQVDREAAATQAEWLTSAQREWEGMSVWFSVDFPKACREGIWDNHPWVEAYARHRLAHPRAAAAPSHDVAAVVERCAQIAERAAIVNGHVYEDNDEAAYEWAASECRSVAAAIRREGMTMTKEG